MSSTRAPAIAAPPCLGVIRSGSVLASLSQAVEECVCNAVDAGSTEVHVEVDAAAFSFKVTDNGLGFTADCLAAVPCRGSTSKLRTIAQFEAGIGTLGFRGEALAALCNTATVELTSRPAGSFETYRKVVCGGATVKYGLALEQRSRQGTVVHVRDMFYNAPVKRKALLSSGIQKEVDRCREVVFRLALVRLDITFTLLDKGRKLFLLRLLKGRCLEQAVSEVFGQPSEGELVQLGGGPQQGVTVGGWAVLPPHGHANGSRQYVYVNGRYVKATPVCKMVDALFAQLYKCNARLEFQHDAELQRTKNLANRHAQFLLRIQCSPASYDVSSEPDKTEVQFRDWDMVLAAAKLAVLQAWTPRLSLALLKQLDQGCGVPIEDQAAPAAPAAADRSGFEGWVASQTEDLPLSALLERRAQSHPVQPAIKAGRRSGSSGDGRELQARLGGAGSGGMVRGGSRDGGSSSGGSERRSAPQWPTNLVGVKHTLVSRLVRFARADGSAVTPAGAVQLGEPAGGCGPPDAAGSSQARVAKRAKADAVWCPAAGMHADTIEGMDAVDAEGMGPAAEAWHAQQASPPPSPGHSVDRLLASWQRAPDAVLAPTSCGLQGSLPRPSSCRLQQHDAIHKLVDSWQPLPVAQLAAISGAAAGTQGRLAYRQQSQPRQVGQPEVQLTQSEHRLLAAVGLAAPVATRMQRPSSAPPHPRRQSNAGPHTNPKSSVSSLQAGTTAAGAVGQRGMRGADTVSGTASSLPAASAQRQSGTQVRLGGSGRITWRQQKPAGLPEGQQRDSTKGVRPSQPPWGLGSQAAEVPAILASPALPNSAGEGSAGNPELHAGRHKPAARVPIRPAPPSFLQSSAPGLEVLLSSWHNPCIAPQTAASGEGVLQLEAVEKDIFAQIKPAALAKVQLQSARALAQVDSKFVPIVCGTVLALVDQHAADERVQLEMLRDQLVGTGSRPQQRRSLALSPPQPLQLAQAEAQLLGTYQDKVRAWGWEWKQAGSGGTHVLTHVPLVLGTALTGTDMKLFLHHLHDTCGAGGFPSGVVRVLNSKACRSAIMFGDELLPVQCQDLVDNLKATQLFFSCAHGRPTTTPLVDLQLLRRALKLRASSKVLDNQGGSIAGTAPVALASRLRQFIQQS